MHSSLSLRSRDEEEMGAGKMGTEETCSYTYGDKGNVASCILKNAKGTKTYSCVYDEHNNVTEVECTSDKSDEPLFVRYYEYEYDSIGNWTVCKETQCHGGVEMGQEKRERHIEYYDQKNNIWQ